MSAPERIWIDSWGGNWSPVSGGTQEHEYVRADTVTARLAAAEAMAEALRVARRTLIEGGGGGVTCTVWVPDDVCPSETLVDHIDAALEKWRAGK